jgi:hypothetical protein
VTLYCCGHVVVVVELIDGPAATDKYRHNRFEDILKREISLQMVKFHSKGVLMVVVGLALNAPWIAALILLKSNFEYKQK